MTLKRTHTVCSSRSVVSDTAVIIFIREFISMGFFWGGGVNFVKNEAFVLNFHLCLLYLLFLNIL